MARPRNLIAWTVIGTPLALALPILGTAIAGLLFPDFRLNHMPLHSLVEGAGGLVALAIAGILLSELDRKADTNHYMCMAAGFLSMGVLDLFHAALTPGNHFNWLRGTATFSGSVFFGLVWIAPRIPQRTVRTALPIVVAFLAIAFGGASIMASSHLPAMRTPEGAFSTTTVALNMTSGIGFLAASMFFVRRFIATGDVEDWLFGMQSALFGAAGLVFPFSVMWDGGWWWSHMLRLAAYVVALSYGLRTFHDADRDLRRARDELDLRVQERTAELEQANQALQAEVAERKRTEMTLQQRTEELERFNQLMAGREERMIELKRQVNERARQLGKPEPYDLSFMEQERGAP